MTDICVNICISNLSKAATSFTSHITVVFAHSVVTNLIVCIFSSTISSFICKLNPRTWHRVKKDLYQYTSQQSAWLYVTLANEKELVAENMLDMNIRVDESSFNSSSNHSWESRSFEIRVQRSKFSDKIDLTVTEMNVLCDVNVVNSRSQWTLMRSSLQLNVQSKISIARLSVLRDRIKSRSDARATLKVRKNDKFKIVQISDTHMITDVEVCKDAIDVYENYLSKIEIDSLTINFNENILNVEKSDFMILIEDQLHHDIFDNQFVFFKMIVSIIERSISFAVVFDNHDSENIHALSRE